MVLGDLIKVFPIMYLIDVLLKFQLIDVNSSRHCALTLDKLGQKPTKLFETIFYVSIKHSLTVFTPKDLGHFPYQRAHRKGMSNNSTDPYTVYDQL